jgi:hypothetical protein
MLTSCNTEGRNEQEIDQDENTSLGIIKKIKLAIDK